MSSDQHSTEIALLRQSIEHLTEKVEAFGIDRKAISQLTQALNIQGERVNHVSARQTDHEKGFRDFVKTNTEVLANMRDFIRAEVRRTEDQNRESMQRLHKRMNDTDTRVDLLESHVDRAKGGLFVSQVVSGGIYAVILAAAIAASGLLFNLRDITTKHEEQLRLIDGRFNTNPDPNRREATVSH